MGVRLGLKAGDIEVVQEAISYMSKRFFDPLDSQRILEIEESLDIVRRSAGTGAASPLLLEEHHVPLLRRVLGAYIDELKRPSSASANRGRVNHLLRLEKQLSRKGTLLGKIIRWLGLG